MEIFHKFVHATMHDLEIECNSCYGNQFHCVVYEETQNKESYELPKEFRKQYEAFCNRSCSSKKILKQHT